ncbi:unnamed protein product [Echinostoma caproni]|uniref:SH2 domain-containing protein n=1 Tax=Echinostoma caproni TaxID=27848 RepID=A0A183ANT4_9TREM|nr:unnamed protein product [Echinostoma caproni]
MGLRKKSRSSSAQSDLFANTTDRSVHFTCPAERLDRSVSSQKHSFSAEHVEKLMKKHMKKRPHPVTILCTDDRILFRPGSGSRVSRHVRAYAKYGDIRHIFIYSLNPRLFMVCVEDSERKSKKYYESFRCQQAEDVNRLCEVTATAKQNGNRLTSAVMNQFGDVYADDPIELNESERQKNGMDVEEIEEVVLPMEASKLQHATPRVASAYDSPNRYDLSQSDLRRQYDPTPPISPGIKESRVTEYYDNPRFVNRATPVIPTPSPVILQEQPALRSTFNPPGISTAYFERIQATPPVPSSALIVRDSRRTSKTMQLQVVAESREHSTATYQTYNSRNSFTPKLDPQYRREDIIRLLGDDVTYVISDPESGAKMCQSGPVFLFAMRVYDQVDPYMGDDLVSATNSPRPQYSY